MRFFNFIKLIPVQLLIVISFVYFFASKINFKIIQLSVSISSFFMELLLFLLPILVFSYIFNAIVTSNKKAPIYILFIIIFVFISNFTAINFARLIFNNFNSFISFKPCIVSNKNIELLFQFPFKNCLRIDLVSLSAALCAFIIVFFQKNIVSDSLIKFVEFIYNKITFILQNIIIPLLPLYVLGFLLKMHYQGNLMMIENNCLSLFLVNFLTCLFYMLVLYIITSIITKKKLITLLIDMLPAGITGFSTMSGSIAMPITLNCSKKYCSNKTKTPELAAPIVSNMHMIGDDIMIIITSLSILIISCKTLPDNIGFLDFCISFCIAKMACIGVAGASLLIVLPVLQQKLDFNSQMISLMMTFYVLNDSFGTFFNVMCNGSFIVITDKLINKFNKIFKKISNKNV